MRPNGAEDGKNSNVHVLTKFNFESWSEAIEDQCLKKNRTDEKVKIAFLRGGLSTTHKNDLRSAMKKELQKEKSKRKQYDGADVEDRPYTWALHYIRKEILHGGSDPEELMEKCKKIEAQLHTLSIAEFGYKLNKYHNRFHSMVEEIGSMGRSVAEHVLSMYYQNGVKPHRDLRYLTIDKDKRKGKSYHELYRDYEEALEEMKPTNKGRPMTNENSGRSRQSKGFQGKCHGCGKIGHRENKCWNKHPDLKPKWLKKKEENSSDNSQQ